MFPIIGCQVSEVADRGKPQLISTTRAGKLLAEAYHDQQPQKLGPEKLASILYSTCCRLRYGNSLLSNAPPIEGSVICH